MKPIIKTALTNAVATAIYIAVVASFLFYSGQARMGQTPTVLVPIMILTLFVFSAALTGFLVFGTPLMWYLDGKKKDAISLLGYTLVTLLLIAFAIFLVLIFCLGV